MTTPLGWAILGTGKIARIMAQALSESETGRLVSVASRSAERAAALAEEFEAPHSGGDYGAGIDAPGVDLVYVATNHPAHREWAVRAAEAGKHVLCEKPLAMAYGEGEDIVAAAARAGVFLLEAYAYRSHPQTETFRRALSEGAVGEIRVVDATFGYDAGPNPTNYLLKPELGGGSILDVGCYTTSMAHLVAEAAGGSAGIEPEEVVGLARMHHTVAVDASATAELRFAGGPIARIASSIEVNLDNTVRVIGSEGRVTLTSPWLPGLIGATSEIVIERCGSDPDVIDIPVERNPYTVEVDAIGGLIRSGATSSPNMTPPQSLANQRTLDRWRSAVGMAGPQEAGK